MTCTKSTLASNKSMKTMVQQNICHTYIHHKFIMQTNRHENLFFASYGFKDLLCNFSVETCEGSLHKECSIYEKYTSTNPMIELDYEFTMLFLLKCLRNKFYCSSV